VLNEVALSLGLRAPVSLRVNPDVDAKTHPYISTGLKGNKFGIAHSDALEAYRYAAQLPGLRVVGIDCHIGSQITEMSPYLDAMDRVLDLVAAVEASGLHLEHIDFGGGLGIDYQGDTPPAADALWQALLAKLDARGYGQRKLLLEPGRSLVGNAGLCVTEAVYLKPGEQKNFLVVDAAMNDLPAPPCTRPTTPSCRCSRARATRPCGTWWARCARAATGWAATGHWRCNQATCWRCAPPAPTA